MIIAIVGASSSSPAAGQWRYITGYTATGLVVTVSTAFSATPSALSTYIIYNCGVQPSVTIPESCNFLSTTLQPLTWWPSTSSTIILDQASSAIDQAYMGWEVKITKGACVGQIRKLTGYVGSSRKATVERAWTTSDGQITDAYGASAPIR